ncbi:MAG TPA: rhomboid family intramembrane serine protease [Longimicrobiales bacterium]|nr:rhomboid family intramembrane serine protease [Longimicrobiales bacterium]
MFPLRDDNPTLLTPWITVLLILVNVGVWLYVQGAGVSVDVLGRTVCRFGMIPAEITGRTGDYTGIELGPGLPTCEFGGLRLGSAFTSMFLHGGWLHLIANMWFLWLFGNNVEDAMGHGRFVVFYMLAGAGAAVAHVLAGPESMVPTVGASGAISGVMGAYLLLFPRVRIQTLFVFVIILRIIAVPAWMVLILWFASQLLAGYTDPIGESGIAFWAHIGGFVAGVILVKPFQRRPLRVGTPPHLP